LPRIIMGQLLPVRAHATAIATDSARVSVEPLAIQQHAAPDQLPRHHAAAKINPAHAAVDRVLPTLRSPDRAAAAGKQ
jgi:hypothetical protein